ncbi:MAG: tetratricopeptide repeat protein [Gemmatimonadaceae bacterium]|nr:tetratricopeptide repeat protein [Gemmatimonadaceae bacterium]
MIPVVEVCRALASAGSWGDLCRALENQLDVAAQSPTLIMLYAEGLMRTGQPCPSRRWLSANDTVLRNSGDRSAIRRAANLAGAASLELGELITAIGHFERALDLGRIDGDDLLVARATNNLAVIATIRGRHTEALGLYASAIPSYQRIGNVNGIAESYHNTAIALRKLQRLDAAEDHERRAAEYARQVSNDRLVALTLVGRAEISLMRGDAALAEATATRAARDLATVGDPARQADAIRLTGVARLVMGQASTARTALDQAVTLAAQHNSTLIEAESRWARAQVALALEDRTAALDDAQRAATMFRQLDAPIEFAAVTAWAAQHSLPVT